MMTITTAIHLTALANEMRAFVAQSVERDVRISPVIVFEWADRLSKEVLAARAVRPAAADTPPQAR